jgi:hypothetical protein
MGAIEDQG